MLGPHSPREVRSLEVRPRNARIGEDRAFEKRVLEIGAIEVRAGEIRAAEVRGAELRFYEARSLKVGPDKKRAVEVSEGEVHANEARIAFKATVSSTNPDLTGGFTADGTRTDNANTTIPYPNRGTGYDIEYQTQWRTALYHQYCPNFPKPNHWHVRENSWIGGQKLISETSPPSTANGICAQYLPGAPSAFQTSDAHAIKWGGSLGLSMADIGFDASAQTGYDTNAIITYGFANATQTNYVCGTDTVPSNAKRVVVQTHRNP